MIRSSVLAAFVVLLTSPASAAFAQSDTGDRWGFELGSATDNRSKNVSKTGNDGHIFGSATWESADRRFYVGPAFEGVQSAGSNVELAFAAGFAPEAFGFEFDFNIAYLNRVGAEAGYDEDALELTADIRRAIGPAWGNLQVQYAPDAAGETQSFVWVEAELGWEFTDRLSGSAAVGRREQNDAPDYTGWNAGLTFGLTDAVDVDVRYFDTNAHREGETYQDTVVAEVRFAF
jgi:uncharacterized protein (TIGR02001 family)